MKILPLVFAAFLFPASGAKAQTTNALSPAEIQGRQLAQEILEDSPVTNLTETGVLRIRNSEGTTNIPISFVTETSRGLWGVYYNAGMTGAAEGLMIVHQNSQPNQFFFFSVKGGSILSPAFRQSPMSRLTPSQIMAPFAGSDFWICDLGLDFFHWPDQKIIKQENRRTRACAVLESINPHPSVGGYSRVDTWIDDATLGIVHAEAFDASGKLLKVFDPKSFKKVNGQWELENMEIRNVQTGSRSWIKFDLNAGS